MQRFQRLSIAAVVVTAIFGLIYMHILVPYLLNEEYVVANYLESPCNAEDQLLGEDTRHQKQTKILICGRSFDIAMDHMFPSIPSRSKNTNHVVVIGHDNFHHVQTNNHINAILHAMDYAYAKNGTLALSRKGWAADVLLLFFRGETTVDMREWEEQIERHLDIKFLDDHDVEEAKVMGLRVSEHKTGDDMYYYESNQNASTIMSRRLPVLRYLWSHPTTKGNIDRKGNMCSAISSSLPNNYVVIHSRWMKRNGCLNRLGSLAHRIKDKKGIRIDRKSPCLLEPTYIEHILLSSNALNYPIFVISDGLNPDIVSNLQRHPTFGANVIQVEKNASWVGGDMMLGVLSSIFIGTPISTLSGNIARARIALGFDPKTNYLFPIKDSEDFACTDGQCLYDVQFLNHYVG